MLKITDRKTGTTHLFSINDAHHHIGEDEDENENVPIGNHGSYKLSERLGKEVIEKLSVSDSRYVINEKDMQYLQERYENEKEGLIDQFVVFPMKDKFRDEGERTYSKSNKNISQWVNNESHEKKLLGFGRVDPADIDVAREMVKKFPSKLGLIGLKIHPESERIKLDSNEVIQLYIDCARLNLPIIFHTSYASDVKRIHDGVNKTISLLVENQMENLVGQLNVIAGHFSYNDEEAFRYISHPCIYGETSTLTNADEFIRMAKENINLSKFTNITLNEFREDVRRKMKDDFWTIFHVGTNWSKKLMLGTDHPFLPGENIVDLLETLFCSELSEELHPSMIQNILGKNLIDILPVNADLSPSYMKIDENNGLETRYRKNHDQLKYYVKMIKKKGVSVEPLKRKVSLSSDLAEQEKYSEALDKIAMGLSLGKKGYTLTKMLEDLELDEKLTETEKMENQSSKGQINDVEHKGLKAAKLGQYTKGIKILKKVEK